MNEKVKKILEAYRQATVHITMAQGTDADVQIAKNAVRLICQLFPKSPDNPDGYEPKKYDPRWNKSKARMDMIEPTLKGTEPKPDEGRLLTPKILSKIVRQYNINAEFDVVKLVLQVRREQDAKTASIMRAEKKQRLMCIENLKQQLREQEAESQARVEKVMFLAELLAPVVKEYSQWQALKGGVK